MGDLGPEIASPKDQNALLFDSLPAFLPNVVLPKNIDHEALATAAIAQLETLEELDLEENVIWRDLCAFTGTFRTFYGAHRVQSVWKKLCRTQQPIAFRPMAGTSEIVRAGDQFSWVQMAYTFECRGYPETKCSGFIGLVPDPMSSRWRIWMLTTLLEELKGFPSPDKPAAEPHTNEVRFDCQLPNGIKRNGSFDCVVVGAGFSGLAIAGRLHAMGIKTLILERNPQIGDNWKNRYDSARCKS
jgi:hypothetical protein